jgi:hypothetical protein
MWSLAAELFDYAVNACLQIPCDQSPPPKISFAVQSVSFDKILVSHIFIVKM